MNSWDLIKAFIIQKATLLDGVTALLAVGAWTTFDAIIAELTALGALILLGIRIYIGLKEIKAMRGGERREDTGSRDDRQ